ncbi:DnaJ-like protein subfamily C member 11-like protein, partial [Diplonema papillatum]
VTRIGWDAMFYLSKKTTVNQVGFGVTTYVPYSFIGVGWSTNEQYMSRTELKLTFQRYKFRLDVPIMIASATDGPTVGTYLVAPFLLFKVAQELLIKPLRNINRRREFMKRRIAMREKLWEQRSQALAVQQLLKTEAKRRLDEELGTDGGLVIQNAKYGVLRPQFAEPDDDEKLPPRTLDVTVPLQALVQQHHLILNAGEKHHFDGFYDVDPEGDEEKYLRVRYMFLNMPHE